MAKLYFKVASDWEEVVRLRNEIAKLKQELKNMDSTQSPAAFVTLNTQLVASTQRMDELVTEAAKAGAVMEGDFKKKIFDASQTVNGFTEKIIAQKAVVKDIEADVRRLGDAYHTALKRNPMSTTAKLEEYKSAKKALDEEKAALFGLTHEQANARLSVKKLRDEYTLYKSDGKQVVETNQNIGLSLGKALGVIGGVAALKKLGSEIIRVRGEFQSMQTAIETMVGKDMAGQLIPQIKELAKISPLTISDMVGAEKMMLGFNIQADDTIKYLKALSDISMGESSKFNSLTLAFSQMSAAGKLMGQDLNQMINAGFNPLQVIAEKTGKSIATLKEEMSKGAISAEMVQQAFIDATSAGGKFYGMSENASQIINGQISMMQDAWDNALNEIGQSSEGFIMSGIQATTSLIQNYETVGKVLVGLIATYGTYKTALITNIALTRGWAVAARADALAKGIQTIATKTQTVAQLALNAAMKANPYVLAATLVVGVVSAMWAFHDSATEAEKAQKRFNERQKEAAKQEQEHKQKIDSLVESSRDIALADLQRGESLAELRKEYPKIFAKYDIESIKLADILKLKRQIADEDARRAGEKKQKELADVESEIKYYENLLKSLSGQQGVDGYVKKLKELRADRDVLLQEKGKGISEQFIASLKGVDVSSFDRYISELEKRIKGKGENGKVKLRLPIDAKGSLSDEAIYDVKDIKTLIDTTKTAKKTVEEAAKAEKKTGKEWLDYYKGKYEEADKTYNDFLKSKTAMSDADRDKELKRLKGLRDAAKKTYESKGGVVSSSSKQESEAEKQKKEREAALKAETQRQENLLSLDRKNQQDKINLLKEGTEKKLKQIELDYQKEIDTYNKAKTKYGETDEIKQMKTNADDKRKKSIADVTIEQMKVEQQALNDYLKEYGTYQQQKLAINQEYAEKIGRAQTDGEKKSLKKELESRLKEVNFEELKKSINFADIFGDLNSQSTEALSVMRDKLKKLIEKSAKDLKPTDLKSLQDAFKDIDLKISERNPFGELKRGVDNYRTSTQAVIKAQENLNTVHEGGEVIVGLYTDSTGKIVKKLLTQQQAEANLSKAQKDRLESQSKLTKAINSMGEKGQQLVTAGNDIVDTLTNLGVEIPKSVQDTLEGLGQITSSLASIDLTKPFSILTSMTGMLSGFSKFIGSIFGLGGSDATERYESLKKQLEAINSVYDKIIDKSKEDIVFGGGFSSIDAASTALDSYEKKLLNLQKIADASGRAGASGRHHSAEWHSNKNIGAENFIQMSKIIGKSIKSMDDLYYLTGDELYLIMSQMPEAWGAIDERIRGNLESIVDCKDEAKELKDALNEAITGVSYDNFYSGFIDQLSDMETSYEDMCDNFEDYLRKSMLSGLIAGQYKDQIRKLYDRWVGAGADQNYTKDEIKGLRSDRDKLLQSMLTERDKMAEIFEWESSSVSSQSATHRGVETITQDQAGELTGRITDVQGTTRDIKAQVIQQTETLSILNLKADALLNTNNNIRNIADETRTILANSYLELRQISENTGAIVVPIREMNDKLEKIQRNTENL